MTLNNDLKRLKNNKFRHTSLRDLENIRTLHTTEGIGSNSSQTLKRTDGVARSHDFAG